MKPEKKFEQEIIREFKANGWFAHHFDANGLDGWPDILAIRGTSARLVEVKAGTRLRKEQIAFHSTLSHSFNVSVSVLEKTSGGCVLLDGTPRFSLSSAVLEIIDAWKR